ncbi:hypothetical protein MEBOL_000499 [Melittangium boletus DSM 14713]|uniref:Uncharacterized protein n=1 Tax=Melittangium boletus DSM 14713 TaxID=1294270 RepID=A0A286NVB7_9BACT|nr:hypothetical protein MEBOL_000499 [Melittangium boletus DSM 14713]
MVWMPSAKIPGALLEERRVDEDFLSACQPGTQVAWLRAPKPHEPPQLLTLHE